MIGVVRVAASFLFATCVAISMPVLAVFLPEYLNGSLDRVLVATSILILLSIVPSVLVGGLIWLPALLAAKELDAFSKLAVIVLSPIPGVALLIFQMVQIGGWALKPSPYLVLAVAPFTMLFSGAFLFIDSRWGEWRRSANASVAVTTIALLLAVFAYGVILGAMRT
jgi:hypothetical protein